MGKPCKGRHWSVFADDTGDCGLANGSSEYFGYAVLAIDSTALPDFNRMRSEFRTKFRMYGEVKLKLASHLFSDLTREFESFAIGPGVTVGCCVVNKTRYDGPYLRSWNGKPRNTTWFRQYVLRHAIEIAFEGVPRDDSDHLDVIIDRDVWMSASRLENLQQYLNGTFATRGGFAFPEVHYVTAMDSRCCEGLQAADHLSRVAGALATDRVPIVVSAAIQQCIAAATLVSSDDFTILPELARQLESEGRAGHTKEEGDG